MLNRPAEKADLFFSPKAEKDAYDMAEGSRTIHVVTTDESLAHAAGLAVSEIDGWSLSTHASVEEFLATGPERTDVCLVDKWLRGSNFYEQLKDLCGQSAARTFVICDHNDAGDSIARFCGAAGSISRPISVRKLEINLAHTTEPPAPLPSESRGEGGDPVLPETLLTDISGQLDESLVSALIDPETSLFNYPFLNYKLDEEFKRAKRFGHDLSCVMLGYEGQVDPIVLSQLAGIFLVASRDTDILGRFDETSFLFLLPETGPEGARIMARRVAEEAESEGLKDLVGDPLCLSVGISAFPHKAIDRREDLFGEARRAFLEARNKGGGVIAAV